MMAAHKCPECKGTGTGGWYIEVKQLVRDVWGEKEIVLYQGVFPHIPTHDELTDLMDAPPPDNAYVNAERIPCLICQGYGEIYTLGVFQID